MVCRARGTQLKYKTLTDDLRQKNKSTEFRRPSAPWRQSFSSILLICPHEAISTEFHNTLKPWGNLSYKAASDSLLVTHTEAHFPWSQRSKSGFTSSLREAMKACTSHVWPCPSPGLLCPSPCQWEAEEQCVLLTCPREEAADLRGRMRDPGCWPFSTRTQHHHAAGPGTTSRRQTGSLRMSS